MRRTLAAIALTALVSLAARPSAVLAVQPATWQNSTEAEFAEGEFQGTVVNSRGEVRLGRKVEVLLPGDQAPPVVSALAASGGACFAASGTDGNVYRVAGGKCSLYAKLPSTMVCSLLVGSDGLLVGTGGEKAGLYRVDAKGKVHALWSDEKVKYVWALAANGKTLYAAVGPEAAVYQVNPDGKAVKLYETGPLASNILCLALAPDRKNILYAGTDKDGLVIEIDLARRRGRVILDAEEQEISALVPDGSGGLYVATADTAKASPDGEVAPADHNPGKADNGDDAQPKAAPPAAPEGQPAPKKPEADKPAKTPKPDDQQPAAEKSPEKPKADADADSDDEDGGTQGGKEEKSPPSADKPAATSPAAEPKAQPPAPPPATPKAQPKPSPRPQRRSGPPPSMARTIGARRTSNGSRSSNGGDQQGNAVYHVGADGLVQTLLRRPIAILDMIRVGDQLLLATGNGGDIYSVSLDGDLVSRLADTDATQVTALAAGPGGTLLFATANHGSVGVVSAAAANEGTYVSSVLDAEQIAQWGTIRVQGSAGGEAGKITAATRSGNVAEPDEKTWSDWSGEIPVEGGYLRIPSPTARFLQYRLTLQSAKGAQPVAEAVAIIYQVGNLPPSIQAVAIEASASPPDQRGGKSAGEAMVFRNVAIQAADENSDGLRFTLQFRQAGQDKWIQITDKLDEPKYAWDTRTVADGVYELRVIASDSRANPPDRALTAARISEPIVVDNTPPAVQNLAAKSDGGKLTVSGQATDAATRIASIEYAIDSADEWVTILPADGIADTPRERFSFVTAKLDKGPHRIAIRVKDELGNTVHAALNATAE